MRNLNSNFAYERVFLPTEPGKRERPVFTSSIAPNGAVSLKESGKEDFQSYIESFALSCDMSYVLNQLKAGNDSVLSSSSGFYADISEFPDTYQGMLDLMSNAKNAFNQLPLEKRAEYDHDFNRFFADIGTDHFFSVFDSEKVGEKDA